MQDNELNHKIVNADCLAEMQKMKKDEIIVQSIVTDPPYGLKFMSKEWDHGIPGIPFWKAAYDLLPPGGYLLAFGGTRTFHRLACAIEDAGFEMRDTLMWLYGKGFPKSHNLKDDWEGWGTALKPAWEPIIMARKPLMGTVAANVLTHGVGAINIDECRIPGIKPVMIRTSTVVAATAMSGMSTGATGTGEMTTEGRWPANVVHDGSDEVEAAFAEFGDGNSSRFFYSSKASSDDRFGSKHPTVKPIALMRWLVRMVTPPGGTVLDPFAGSGTMLAAAKMEGFNSIGIEKEEEYYNDIVNRMSGIVYDGTNPASKPYVPVVKKQKEISMEERERIINEVLNGK